MSLCSVLILESVGGEDHTSDNPYAIFPIISVCVGVSI